MSRDKNGRSEEDLSKRLATVLDEIREVMESVKIASRHCVRK